MTSLAIKAERSSAVGTASVSTKGTVNDYREARAMLWTILIILLIVALVLFILGRVRGGRGV